MLLPCCSCCWLPVPTSLPSTGTAAASAPQPLPESAQCPPPPPLQLPCSCLCLCLPGSTALPLPDLAAPQAPPLHSSHCAEQHPPPAVGSVAADGEPLPPAEGGPLRRPLLQRRQHSRQRQAESGLTQRREEQRRTAVHQGPVEEAGEGPHLRHDGNVEQRQQQQEEHLVGLC